MAGAAELHVDAAIKFIDAEKGDYRLALGSPLIDAGVNVGLPFSGKAPDIGAFETGPAAAPGVL